MAQQARSEVVRREMTGIERLGLRVSNMINHPFAQAQRWVTIHRLDSDGDREWEEVMGVLAGTDGLEVTAGEDGSVTVRWEPSEDDELQEEVEGAFAEEEAPF